MSASSPEPGARLLGRPDWLVAALAGVLSWAAFAPHAFWAVDFLHDGMMAKPALDVATGQVPFRDTFLFYGNLTTWVQAAAFRAFGPTIVTLRTTALVAYALTAAALAAAWSCLLPRALTLAVVGCWLANWPFRTFPMTAWPSVYWLCFHALAMLAVLGALREPSRVRWAVAAGIFAGLAFCMRHLPGGVITIAATIAGFLLIGVVEPAWRRDAVRLAVAALGGASGVLALLLATLAWQGTLREWFSGTIGFSFELMSVHGKGLRLGIQALDLQWRHGLALVASWVLAVAAARWLGARRAALAVVPIALGAVAWLRMSELTVLRALWGAWPLALLAVAAATALAAGRQRGHVDGSLRGRLAVLPLCLGAAVLAYPIGDPLHSFWALASSYGLVAFGAWQLAGRRTWLATAALLVTALPGLLALGPTARPSRPHPEVRVARPPILAGMWTSPAQKAELERLADALDAYGRERPSWPMLLEADLFPLFLTLAPDLSNPGAMPCALHGLRYDGARRARFVRERRPLVVLPRDGRTSEPVQQAMDAIGYRSLVRFPWAEVRAPAAGVP